MAVSTDYRQGFIEGAVISGMDSTHALWAASHDMQAARVARAAARTDNDPIMWQQVRNFVAESRMWWHIAMRLKRAELEIDND